MTGPVARVDSGFNLPRTDRYRNLRDLHLATDTARAWSPAHVARMRASYGPKSGPKAGSRASSPGEQAAACDYRKTRELGYKTRGLGSTRELRLRALGRGRQLGEEVEDV